MAEAEEAAAILDVFRVDPATGAERRAGAVELFAGGRLAVLEADPAWEAKLRAAIEAVNGKPQIVELVPPAAATEAGQTAARVTPRSDPNFLQAVNRYLVRYYAFSIG